MAVTEETSLFAPSFRRRRNGRDFGYVDYRNAGIVNVPVYRILIWMLVRDLLLIESNCSLPSQLRIRALRDVAGSTVATILVTLITDYLSFYEYFGILSLALSFF